MAETAEMMLPRRECLHALRSEMTAEQLAEMTIADARAIDLYARHKGHEDPYSDIRALGDIVALIEQESGEPS